MFTLFLQRSTTAITAFTKRPLSNLHKFEKKISIDPLLQLNSWKKVLNSQSEFNYFVKNKMKKILKSNFKKKKAQKFARNYFMKLNSKSIYKSLSN